MENLNSSLFKFKLPENDAESVSGSEVTDGAADVLQDLPREVIRRIYALENLQDKRAELERLFKQELALLEKKYEDLYAPLYEDRSKVISGEREVTEEEYKDRELSHVTEVQESSAAVAGIPEFWVNVLSRSQLESLVFDSDCEALGFLRDIKSERIMDPEAPKLIVSFEFAPNPFFNDAVLTKTVVFNAAGNSVLQVVGSPINWKEGKNLCVRKETKKMRHRSKPGVVTTKEETIDEPSFFHFFDEIAAHDEEHVHDDEDEDDGCGRLMADAEICSFLDKFIIPYACDWYTCKAQASLFGEDDEYEYSDYSDEEGSEDEDEDEEDDE